MRRRSQYEDAVARTLRGATDTASQCNDYSKYRTYVKVANRMIIVVHEGGYATSDLVAREESDPVRSNSLRSRRSRPANLPGASPPGYHCLSIVNRQNMRCADGAEPLISKRTYLVTAVLEETGMITLRMRDHVSVGTKPGEPKEGEGDDCIHKRNYGTGIAGGRTGA
jgi:hypothetical protein